MKWKKLIAEIEEIAPLELQESWDNSGVQLLWEEKEIKRVLVAMEITGDVVSEAIYGDIDLIITHHPLIFGGIRSVDYRYGAGKYIAKLAEKKIAVYSSHTPFDKAKGGNNDYIADMLGLKDIVPFTKDGVKEPIGRVGRLTWEMKLEQLVEQLAEIMEMEPGQLRFAGKPETAVEFIGICTGAGADLMDLAAESGCDVLITGDLKYHQAQDALEKGFSVIDAGHYGTEKYFTDNFTEKLYERTKGQIEIFKSEVNLNPFSVY